MKILIQVQNRHRNEVRQRPKNQKNTNSTDDNNNDNIVTIDDKENPLTEEDPIEIINAVPGVTSPVKKSETQNVSGKNRSRKKVPETDLWKKKF